MDELWELAEEKAAVCGHASQDWLETMRQCTPDLLHTLGAEEAVKRIIDSCASPAQLALITEALTGNERASPGSSDGWGELIRRVEHSPYTLADWIAALEAFTLWLEKEGRSAEYISALGYLDCCVEYIPAAPGAFPFPELVRTFLDEFGYEGSSEPTFDRRKKEKFGERE